MVLVQPGHPPSPAHHDLAVHLAERGQIQRHQHHHAAHAKKTRLPAPAPRLRGVHHGVCRGGHHVHVPHRVLVDTRACV